MSTPRVEALTIVPPPTVTLLAASVSSRIPFAAPLVETLENAYVPVALLNVSAVPVVVVIELSLTLIPVIAPVPATPANVPVETARPCSFAFVASMMVPPIVVVPVPIAGRAIVPAGGVIANSVSNGPVAAWPISHSPELSVRPLVVAPLYTNTRWFAASTASAAANVLNGLASVPVPPIGVLTSTNQITGPLMLKLAVTAPVHCDAGGPSPLSQTV